VDALVIRMAIVPSRPGELVVPGLGRPGPLLGLPGPNGAGKAPLDETAK
jgi:hypothetical protein